VPEPFPLNDAVAVLTGAASGIGRALALGLAREGCHLALADRNGEGLTATASDARAQNVSVSEHVFDVADSAALARWPDAVLAQHGHVSLLINCAGVALAGTFDEISVEELEWLFAINFWAPVRLMKAFLPAMRLEKAAQIVNISSLFGIVGLPGQSAYTASKFALRGISESIRHELELTNGPVRLTVVHPGGIRTNIASNARIAAAADHAKRAEQAAQFEKALRMPPEQAAARIIRGIKNREARVLVGADALIMDRIQRLRPTSYYATISKMLPKAK
jgi:short-subunit dehydrogenase